MRETLARECATTTCAAEPIGTGITSVVDARITGERFRITRNAFAGLQLARGGVIDLTSGEVTENAIGANVQTEGYDLARITDRVIYRDNGRDLDSTLLPVPDDGVP